MDSVGIRDGGADLTFLAFMEYRRSRMIDTGFVWICEAFAAPFVHTLSCHVDSKETGKISTLDEDLDSISLSLLYDRAL